MRQSWIVAPAMVAVGGDQSSGSCSASSGLRRSLDECSSLLRGGDTVGAGAVGTLEKEAVGGAGARPGSAPRGIKTSFARPIPVWGELFRILVLTARAAPPIASTNSSETTTATFDLMTSP